MNDRESYIASLQTTVSIKSELTCSTRQYVARKQCNSQQRKQCALRAKALAADKSRPMVIIGQGQQHLQARLHVPATYMHVDQGVYWQQQPSAAS